MNSNTGALYPSFAEAIAAGERESELVEIRGTRAQAERISAAVKAANRAERRAESREQRRRGRGFTK